ncbi:hypothetical protein K503DRAFT_706907 [Rhizopogon vinicolor AM-OR11-026]|uniref:T6SS Phospholipase effector Tle1-like catalytic domain-containing protein n=1 Tax=Rhizopogon vinicolor AM-OR11-026 TaxID=1314800 RepID=A0A1B7NHC5_9AGAM|nr:hypothetical protein K503DRAFT_706907 [Rhizopogon vinicolor AM-OR11-026]
MVTEKTPEAPGVELDFARVPRALTMPLQTSPKFKKRIIICCDGTWQDGVTTKECWQRTNILKLSRALDHVDERSGFPIPQIVYYQSGVGSAHNLYSQYVEGATGASLIDKVQEAYAFISQNYHPGDEIFLFGFSRGAYTARMVAMFIGAIGVLDRTDMDHFPEIFLTYQQMGKETDPTKTEQLIASLSKWTSHESRGKRRADSDDRSFSIKCVGVFDTVGSVGLPEELTHKLPSTKSVFGFPNNELGEHIERAYHALAIDETRLDFNCCKFEQTDGGRKKGQILKQCWFSGSHSDIGGGWQEHDLSDLTLAWMAANIGDMLSIDITYIASLPDPADSWGEQPPHDSRTGIFAFSEENVRTLPTVTDNRTHETIHPSVLRRDKPIQINPSLLCELLPFEEELQKNWPHIERSHDQKQSNRAMRMLPATSANSYIFNSSATQVVSVVTDSGRGIVQTRVTTSQEANSYAESRSSRFAFFGVIKEMLLSSG